MHTPSVRRHLSALNDVPIYRVNLALPLRGNLFNNVAVMKHEGHCATPQMITDETSHYTHDVDKCVGLLELKSTVHFPELSNCPRISWYSLPQNP
jgi:hypothetical protein